jgi:hypothetical protein
MRGSWQEGNHTTSTCINYDEIRWKISYFFDRIRGPLQQLVFLSKSMSKMEMFKVARRYWCNKVHKIPSLLALFFFRVVAWEQSI